MQEVNQQSFLCGYLCVCMCTCPQVCRDAYILCVWGMWLWRLEITSLGCFPWDLLILFPERVSHYAGLISQQAPWTYPSLPPQCFWHDMGDKSRSSCWYGNHFISLAHVWHSIWIWVPLDLRHSSLHKLLPLFHWLYLVVLILSLAKLLLWLIN